VSCGLAAVLLVGCLAEPRPGLLPEADWKPPGLLEAGPADERRFILRFDEPVEPLAGSFGLEALAAAGAPAAAPGPAAVAAAAVEGELRLEFGAPTLPGREYAVSGEVADARGNATRFALRFIGYNARPPRLRLSELQTAKNTALTNLHRDYAELEILEAGNLGGVELAWSSSVKAYAYRFPAAEVARGDFVVLHLAPEGLAAELDETGSELGLSGGVDSRPFARDFWSKAGGLPDESGAVLSRLRPGAAASDGLFYGDEAKTGPVASGPLAELVLELAGAGAWPLAGAEPAWEDAFRWNPSSSRSLNRVGGGERGAAAWYVGAAKGQSPGAANAPP